MAHPETTVTACIPYFKGRRYIRRAVTSILAQTHRNLRVIVINDGDRNPPWDLLADINDIRLLRFDLQHNHGGPFFANAVAVSAAASPWFLVQEQDDWSEQGRVQTLLQLASARGADVALSAQCFHREQLDGSSRIVGKRWQHIGRFRCPSCKVNSRCSECFVDTGLNYQYRYRAPHAGLFRVDLLRRLGGYYAGLNLHYDALLMNLVMMSGTIAHTASPLYHRLLRSDSITHSQLTGLGTEPSNAERRTVTELYGKSFHEYQRYLRGELSSTRLTESIRYHCSLRVTASDRYEIESEAKRLRASIHAS